MASSAPSSFAGLTETSLEAGAVCDSCTSDCWWLPGTLPLLDLCLPLGMSQYLQSPRIFPAQRTALPQSQLGCFKHQLLPSQSWMKPHPASQISLSFPTAMSCACLLWELSSQHVLRRLPCCSCFTASLSCRCFLPLPANYTHLHP